MRAMLLDSLICIFSASLTTHSGIFQQESCGAKGGAVLYAWYGHMHTRVQEEQEEKHPTALVSHPSFVIFSMFLCWLSMFFGENGIFMASAFASASCLLISSTSYFPRA